MRLLRLNKERHIVTIAVNCIVAHFVGAAALRVRKHDAARRTRRPPSVPVHCVLSDCYIVTLVAVKTS